MRIIKKVFSLLASALFVLIVSGFLNLRQISPPLVQAHDTDADPCKAIFMVAGKDYTDPVPSPPDPGREGGISDSGQFHFGAQVTGNADLEKGGLLHAYRACVKNAAANGTTTIQGWVWNSNVGFVSFYCKDGKNLSPDGTKNCDNLNDPPIDYETVVLANNRDIRGWAWGDNIGWISMGCDATGKNMGNNCGNTKYGVKIAPSDNFDTNGACTNIAQEGIVNKGDLYGFAFNEAVGWINFCGAHAEFSSGVTATVNIEENKGGDNRIDANGSDSYDVVVAILENGVLKGPTDYRVKINSQWINTLKADQITDPPSPVKAARTPSNGESGILTNCQLSGPSAENFCFVQNKGYVARITSFAPTVEANADKLKLNSLVVSVKDQNNQPVTVKQISAISFPYAFTFAEPVEVLEIRSVRGPNRLFARRGQAEPHTITVETHPASTLPDTNQIRIFTQLYDCSDNFDFLFDDNRNGTLESNEIIDYPYPSTPTQLRPSNIWDDPLRGVCQGKNNTLRDIDKANPSDQPGSGAPLNTYTPSNSSNTVFTAQRFIYGASTQATSIVSEDNALGIQMRVEYEIPQPDGQPSIPVKYFSKKVTDSSLINQGVDVRGDIQSTFVQEASGVTGQRTRSGVGERIAESLKNIRANREIFLRATKQELGKKPPINSPLGTSAVKTFAANELNNLPDSSILYYKRLSTAPDPCQIKFEDSADINMNRKVSIVTQGCDVYINKNIIGAGELGLIALQDFSLAGNRKGGNFYIKNNVTDIMNTHFVGDGSIFSYCDGTECSINQDGRPNFGNQDIKIVLKDQLTITGSLISSNTIGGSEKMLLGDGTKTPDANLAKQYDLNWLRWANTKTAPTSVNQTNCWADIVIFSKQLLSPTHSNSYPTWDSQARNGICFYNFPAEGETGHSIVNINYKAPSKDLKIFNRVAR